MQRSSYHSQSEAAAIISQIKDKSIDEFRKLLSNKDAYIQLMFSLDQVKNQNNLQDELRRETLHLAEDNLEKEPRILEIRNQCRIIRTTELAVAVEKLYELQRRKEEIFKFYSLSTHLQMLQDSMIRIEEEGEAICNQFLEKEIDMNSFGQKLKKLRMEYHRQSLVHLSARISSPGTLVK